MATGTQSYLSSLPLIDRTRPMPRVVLHHPTPDPEDAYEVLQFPDGTVLPAKEVLDLTGHTTRQYLDDQEAAHAAHRALRGW